MESVKTRKLVFVLMLGISVTITFLLSLSPDLKSGDIFGMEYRWYSDMIFHGSYYFLISMLFCMLLPKESRTIILITILIISYSLEVMQGMGGERSISLIDFIANTIGISCAYFIRRRLDMKVRLFK